MGARDLGALVLLAALWGASYMFIRVAVPALGPFTLMGLRVALAASILALYAAIIAREMPKFRSRWREYLVVGTTNSAIPFSLIAAAEIELTASLAAILNSTTALFVARSEEHTSELQSRQYLVCRLLLEKKKKTV